ncbi:hypothetical protein SCAR479_02027 [Seiridium cardinale]|uniref:DUF7580 domain-containing protein n=1 Tax=Seiridium cardinale TaxID=138064 RepID=A0ABR2Y4L8_9PEZI
MMMNDSNHISWNDENLANAIARSFGESNPRTYRSCFNVMKDIRESQQELGKQLATFDMIQYQKQAGETIKATYRRLRQTVSLKFNMKDINEKIKQMRRGNEDLEALHSQMIRFKQQKQTTAAVSAGFSILPKDMSTFTCNSATHTEHWAALCLDKDVVSSETLEVAFSCVITSNGPQSEQCLQMSLRSQEEPSTTTSKREASRSTKLRRRKKLRFLDEDDGNNLTSEEVDVELSSLNLSSITDICNFLGTHCNSARPPTGFKNYLGYLQASRTCRHIFYVSPSVPLPFPRPKTATLTRRGPSLRDLFQAIRREQLTLEYQLAWALKLSLAVLQFHSTPWLHDDWRTSDLLLPDLSLSTTTQLSLLLRASLPTRITEDSPCGSLRCADVIMEGSSPAQDPICPDDEEGIYNRHLWGLGTALLEIGHWQSLDQFEEDTKFHGNKYRTVRRFSKQTTFLGDSYNKIARTCLQCNFGCENDLSSPEL